MHSLLQARVKEQQTQKKLFNLGRTFSIGGGILLVVVVLWATMLSGPRSGDSSSSKNMLCFVLYMCSSSVVQLPQRVPLPAACKLPNACTIYTCTLKCSAP